MPSYAFLFYAVHACISLNYEYTHYILCLAQMQMQIQMYDAKQYIKQRLCQS